MSFLTVTLTPSYDVVWRTSRLLPNDSTRASVELRYAGGKGNNVARALSRLGGRVTATGFQGGHSRALAKETGAWEGCAIHFIECCSPTRTTVVVHETDTGFTYVINEPGQAVEASEATELLEKFNRLITNSTICLLCGSGQASATESLFAEMIRIARQHEVICLLDSSGAALKQGIKAAPYLLKVNAEELGDYLNRSLSSQTERLQALHDLAASGIQLAAISLGADGIIASDGGQTWYGKLHMPRVTNIVGCGDSALAGMALAINSGLGLPEMLRWGVACGAANTHTTS